MSSETPIDRRRFVGAAVLAAGAFASRGVFAAEKNPEPTTIGNVIDLLIAEAKTATRNQTVDTVKTGDRDRPLTGVVTTFLANVEVIRRAIELGANLIVSHEPVFYNHLDETGWLESNPVYQYKRKLLDERGIVVFRYHDYLHSVFPDPVSQEIVKRLGWQGKAVSRSVFDVGRMEFRELVAQVAQSLDLAGYRYIGDETMPVSKVGLMVGAPGGQRQIEFMAETGVDVLIAGEIHEWEVSEYVRDANAMGKPRGLLIIGHQPSEEDGMIWVADWLRKQVPEVRSIHVPSRDPFTYKGQS